MSQIDVLIVNEALRHIQTFGFVKNMDPMALHILKTSEKPIVAAFRHWMRRTAVQQAKEAEREQKKMNDEFAQEEYSRKSPIRRCAVVHPYYASKAVQQGDSWNDKKFLGRLKRDNPKCFPEREAR
jgi:hypothetical protein